MYRGKEWWLPRIAEAIVAVGLWGLALFEATTQGERVVLWLASMTIWLPGATKALVGFVLRIRLAPPSIGPNIKSNRLADNGQQEGEEA
jgi:hypothetical protein